MPVHSINCQKTYNPDPDTWSKIGILFIKLLGVPQIRTGLSDVQPVFPGGPVLTAGSVQQGLHCWLDPIFTGYPFINTTLRKRKELRRTTQRPALRSLIHNYS